MEPYIKLAAELGGTVFTVSMFLWYLSKRDREINVAMFKTSDSNVLLAVALQRLSDKLDESIISNTKTTDKLKENVEATKENTNAIISTNGKH